MADFKALDYLSNASDFTVTKEYEPDDWGKNTNILVGYKVQMQKQSRYGDEIYALADVDSGEIGYYICGGDGYDAYDARIDLDRLKELIQFCETMTREK